MFVEAVVKAMPWCKSELLAEYRKLYTLAANYRF
jgi:hypothetical protein